MTIVSRPWHEGMKVEIMLFIIYLLLFLLTLGLPFTLFMKVALAGLIFTNLIHIFGGMQYKTQIRMLEEELAVHKKE